jgi:hypothetical protein
MPFDNRSMFYVLEEGENKSDKIELKTTTKKQQKSTTKTHK